MPSPHRNRNSFKWLWAVAELHSSREVKALLWPLALHADGNGESFPGEATLCRESGIGSERTLRRTLRRLEKMGWIKTSPNSRPVKIHGKAYFVNTYALTIPTGRADTIVTGHGTETGGQIEQDGRSNPTPRAVNASGMGGQSSGRQTAKELPRNDQREGPAASAAALSLVIPSWETVRSFGLEKGIPEAEIRKAFDYYTVTGTGWRDKQGSPVRNWQAKLLSWKNYIRAMDSQSAPVSPEDARRKEVAERRKRDIREAAETIQARLSWIEAGEKNPYGDGAADIEAARSRIEKLYGPGALSELEKSVAEVKEEKRLETERRKTKA